MHEIARPLTNGTSVVMNSIDTSVVSRRHVLKMGAGVVVGAITGCVVPHGTALGTPGPGESSESAGAVPNSAGTQPPREKAPVGAVDSHIHIFDHRFPMVSGDRRVIADATVDQYRLLQRRLGLSRVVVVQPSTYGTDNRCLLEALAHFGADARGIVVVDTVVTDAELRQMASSGVRGIRVNVTRGAATSLDMIRPLAQRIAPFGWHVQVHIEGDELANAASTFEDLPVPLVFDHMGRIPAASGISHPAFAVIRRLLEKGRTWVKLSGAYLVSPGGAPAYEDVQPLASALFALRPDRMVWGSDWPHPAAKVIPDDALLMDLVATWVDDPSARSRIFLENPRALYGFQT